MKRINFRTDDYPLFSFFSFIHPVLIYLCFFFHPCLDFILLLFRFAKEIMASDVLLTQTILDKLFGMACMNCAAVATV